MIWLPNLFLGPSCAISEPYAAIRQNDFLALPSQDLSRAISKPYAIIGEGFAYSTFSRPLACRI